MTDSNGEPEVPETGFDAPPFPEEFATRERVTDYAEADPLSPVGAGTVETAEEVRTVETEALAPEPPGDSPDQPVNEPVWSTRVDLTAEPTQGRSRGLLAAAVVVLGLVVAWWARRRNRS